VKPRNFDIQRIQDLVLSMLPEGARFSNIGLDRKDLCLRNPNPSGPAVKGREFVPKYTRVGGYSFEQLGRIAELSVSNEEIAQRLILLITKGEDVFDQLPPTLQNKVNEAVREKFAELEREFRERIQVSPPTARESAPADPIDAHPDPEVRQVARAVREVNKDKITKDEVLAFAKAKGIEPKRTPKGGIQGGWYNYVRRVMRTGDTGPRKASLPPWISGERKRMEDAKKEAASEPTA